MYIISIHALREEGDEALRPITREQVEFLSTPSARRATSMSWAKMSNPKISIHALREEGDGMYYNRALVSIISIHALREEGDLLGAAQGFCDTMMSIHALREEGDLGAFVMPAVILISIHALREEGDPKVAVTPTLFTDFYPRPPRGGRQQTCR